MKRNTNQIKGSNNSINEQNIYDNIISQTYREFISCKIATNIKATIIQKKELT